MKLTITAVYEGNAAAVGITRLALAPGEVFRLPYSCRQVRADSGGAWISANGRDILLTPGEADAVASRAGDPALISALGDMPVVLEWEGVNELCRSRTRISFWRRWRARFGNRPQRVGRTCA